MEWILVKTLFSLAAVLALMVGVLYVLRKYVYQSPGGGGSSAVPVEVLGQRSLHPKRSIVIVKVMRTVLVIGMSEQGMQTLATIDDEESLAEIDGKLEVSVPESRWMVWRGAEAPASFGAHLQESIRSFLGRRGEPGRAAADGEAPVRGARRSRRNA